MSQLPQPLPPQPNVLEWECPICVPFVRIIGHTGPASLRLSVSMHIRWHESIAAQKAVDKARIECGTMHCDIGRNKVWNTVTRENENKPTEYDLRMLHGMKILWD